MGFSFYFTNFTYHTIHSFIRSLFQFSQKKKKKIMGVCNCNRNDQWIESTVSVSTFKLLLLLLVLFYVLKLNDKYRSGSTFKFHICKFPMDNVYQKIRFQWTIERRTLHKYLNRKYFSIRSFCCNSSNSIQIKFKF